MKAIGIDVDDCDTEAGHRISKSKGNSKKTVAPFCNRKLSKRALYNKTKLASINTSAVGLGNSTKRFISKNLMDYNYKLVFKCRKIKRASLIYSTFTRDGVVHIMKSDCGMSEKDTHMSKLVELIPNFDFYDEEWGFHDQEWGLSLQLLTNCVPWLYDYCVFFIYRIVLFKCKHLS